jgi:hypothetical protein
MSRITIMAAMLFSAGLISMNAGPADAAAIIDTSRTSAQGQIKAGVRGQGGVFDCRPNVRLKRLPPQELSREIEKMRKSTNATSKCNDTTGGKK